jgi:hypothetical protein
MLLACGKNRRCWGGQLVSHFDPGHAELTSAEQAHEWWEIDGTVSSEACDDDAAVARAGGLRGAGGGAAELAMRAVEHGHGWTEPDVKAVEAEAEIDMATMNILDQARAEVEPSGLGVRVAVKREPGAALPAEFGERRSDDLELTEGTGAGVPARPQLLQRVQPRHGVKRPAAADEGAAPTGSRGAAADGPAPNRRRAVRARLTLAAPTPLDRNARRGGGGEARPAAAGDRPTARREAPDACWEAHMAKLKKYTREAATSAAAAGTWAELWADLAAQGWRQLAGKRPRDKLFVPPGVDPGDPGFAIRKAHHSRPKPERYSVNPRFIAATGRRVGALRAGGGAAAGLLRQPCRRQAARGLRPRWPRQREAGSRAQQRRGARDAGGHGAWSRSAHHAEPCVDVWSCTQMAARVKQESGDVRDGGWPADFQRLRRRPFDQVRAAACTRTWRRAMQPVREFSTQSHHARHAVIPGPLRDRVRHSIHF